MSIPDLNGGGLPERVPGASSRIDSSERRLQRPAQSSDQGTSQAQYVPDPEVSRLVSQIGGAPDIRTDLVDQVRQEIQSGDFLSRQNAQATAEAFLR